MCQCAFLSPACPGAAAVFRLGDEMQSLDWIMRESRSSGSTCTSLFPETAAEAWPQPANNSLAVKYSHLQFPPPPSLSAPEALQGGPTAITISWLVDWLNCRLFSPLDRKFSWSAGGDRRRRARGLLICPVLLRCVEWSLQGYRLCPRGLPVITAFTYTSVFRPIRLFAGAHLSTA